MPVEKSKPKPRGRRTDVFNNPVDCVRVFDRSVVGYSHLNQKGLERLPFIRGLNKGTKLVLVPEPNNPADRNAILVYVAGDMENDIGYLDAVGAREICPLFERGATFSAEVFYVFFDSPDHPITRILIYQLTPPILKQRPVRKDAPHYKQTLPASGKEKRLRSESVATIRESSHKHVGFWSSLKKFFLG